MPVERGALTRYFLRLGTSGFGGPVALIAAMHRDLVERRQWFTETQYRQGVMLAQVSPGPLAAQLCFYLAYIGGGIRGAIWSGIAFVLPSFVMVVALGWAYQRFGGIPEIRSIFYGVGAAVTGILVISGWHLVRKTIRRDALLALIFLALAFATVRTGREPVLLILSAGFIAWIVRAPPARLWRRSTVTEAGSLLLLAQLAGFFTYAGAFVFGSGLAIVPFLHGGLVLGRGWLSETQFLDAVAVALITPGPVVITTGFVGYLVAGFPGAVVAAAATFLPCFAITLLLAPQVERYAGSPGLTAAAAGITGAATGALAGAVILISRQAVVDLPTALIAIAAALGVVFKFPAPALILMAAAVGLLLR